MKVIVGLGNPGAKYAGTRHNVGFDVLDQLVRDHPGGAVRTKFDAELCDLQISGVKVLLCAPQTFMNLSGRSVRQLADFYKVDAADLLVVCDDLNLDIARLRLRASGSAGGQKGLQSIIDHLGTQDFARLRIGIGRPPGRMDAAAYVLKRFTADERAAIDIVLRNAATGIETWVSRGIQHAMNAVNVPASASAQETPGEDSESVSD